jgi:hypothetical protein
MRPCRLDWEEIAYQRSVRNLSEEGAGTRRWEGDGEEQEEDEKGDEESETISDCHLICLVVSSISVFLLF